MANQTSFRRRSSRFRSLFLVGALASTALAATPGPASAGIDGCVLTAKKPGGSGASAFGRFAFYCLYAIPFQYQVAVWERDEGPDQKLSQTGWVDGLFPSGTTSYAGKGPAVACQTEAGKEELYTKVRARVGTPGEYHVDGWETSPVLTTRTCQ